MEYKYAAQELEGRTLTSGWKVLRKISKPVMQGTDVVNDFSVYYEVEKDGIQCYMKAIDFSQEDRGDGSVYRRDLKLQVSMFFLQG